MYLYTYIGGFICKACGGQSQDYIKESFDIDEGMEGNTQGVYTCICDIM
jgi:hypothetical protein